MLATLLIYSGVTPVENCNGTPASIEGVDERVGSTVFICYQANNSSNGKYNLNKRK